MNPVSGHKQTAQCEHAGDADAAAQDPSRRCFLQWSALAVAAGLLRVPLAAAGSSAGHVQTLPSQRYYDGDPAAGQNPLRFASSGNVVHNGKESIGKRGVQIRWPYVLGSSDLSELRLLLDNWCFSYRNNAMVNPGNTLPIQGASLEIAGLVKPITFGGAAGITLDDGANDVLSDPLTPADFALATFARGTTVYVKMLVMFDLSTVSNLCNSSARSTSQSGARVAWFDPTVTTSSDVYAAGQWTQTGDAVQSRPNGYVPKLVGRHVDAAAKAWLCVGDSLCQGTGDAGSATRVAGLGWMSRAMRDSSDADASQIGYMNMAVNGSTSTLALADARSATLARYATHAVVMYGTNDIGVAGTGVSLNTLQTRLSAIYSMLRANQVQKILAAHLLPRTTSTDGWATEANQNYSGGPGGWDSTGVAAQLNAWLAPNVGPAVDAFQHWPSIRGTDDLKFLATGTPRYATTDGTHPTTAGYGLMAADVRAQMDAL
jgi:lysophospholipase L1-like esterase